LKAYIFLSLLSFFLTTFVSAILVKQTSSIKKFIDIPNHRKVHKRKIARNGGLAMFMAILVTWLISLLIGKKLLSYELAASISIVFLIGLVDDAVELGFKIKFLFQILAATICIQSGFVIKDIPITFFGVWNNTVLRIFLTYLWIIGITNAINLIDGIDGLASVVVMSSSLLLFLKFNDPLALILASVCIGFLLYNWNPAKIFMGDSGSYLLGFLISLITLRNFTMDGKTWIIGMGLFLGYPILDTFYAFVRRLLKKKNPFSPDQEHFHHQLLEKGLSQKIVLLNLSSLSLLLNFLGIFLYQNSVVAFILYISLSIFFYFYVRSPLEIKRSL